MSRPDPSADVYADALAELLARLEVLDELDLSGWEPTAYDPAWT